MKGIAAIKSNQGLSLIELLIAMVLGLTLTAGIIQIYVGTSTTERDQEARLRIQENGRFAMNYLGQEVRMAGYLGCLGAIGGATVNSTLDSPPVSFQPGVGVQGWEADGTDPGTINNSAANVAVVETDSNEWDTSGGNNMPDGVNGVPNSDILRVWVADGNAGVVSTITQGVTPSFVAENDVGIAANDFLILSDCEQADFVQACVVTPIGGTTTSTISLSTACNPGNEASAPITSIAPAEVVRLQGTLFYVGKRDDDATNTSALFRRRLSATGAVDAAEELIEGVESMQILYGINLDQDIRSTADTYLPADQVTDWADVISVRISLLLQSVDDGTVPFPQPYTFDGVIYDGDDDNGELPQDTRVRRTFTNTISLRNRALGF